MKAIQAASYGDSKVLRLVELPRPEPGPGEVRVRVHAAGVNPVEVYIRSGGYAAHDPGLPYVPGFDAAGVVDAVGDGVTAHALGDRVFVAAARVGSYAEWVVAAADEVGSLPAGVSYEEGAAIGVPGLAAYRAVVLRGGLQPGERVLVHGASGAVGQLAVQLARGLGAVVIGTAGSPAGLQAVLDLGVDALDHTEPGHLAAVRHATDGGVDLIVEMLANENLAADFEALARHGRIVVVGSRGSLTFDPRLLIGAEADVRGVANWSYRPDERAAAVAELARRLADGSIVPLVGARFPLAEAGAAQDHVMTTKATGKVVLVVRED